MWNEAIVEELKPLRDLGSFKMVDRPRGGKILQSTWVFKRKRCQDGELKKYKARLCVHGDQKIDGVEVFQSCAPVLSWITVRLIPIFLLYSNFKLKKSTIQMTFARHLWINFFL